jgi:hypothetical protein
MRNSRTGEENSDATVACQMIAREPVPTRVYGDSGYGTGTLRAELAHGGHTAVIKPGPLRTRCRRRAHLR